MRIKKNMLICIFMILVLLLPKNIYANTSTDTVDVSGKGSQYTGPGIFTTNLMDRQIDGCEDKSDRTAAIRDTIAVGMGVQENTEKKDDNPPEGAETEHDDTKLQEGISETLKNMMASTEDIVGNSCDDGNFGFFKAITNVAKPVILTNIKPLMSLSQYVQGIALGLVVIMVVIYGYELMFKRDEADDVIAFVFKLGATSLGIAFAPYLFQDILNINNIIVYFISQIELYVGLGLVGGTINAANVAIVPMAALMAPAILSTLTIVATLPAALPIAGLAIVIFIFIFLIALFMPLIKIMLWWYVRLFTLMLMFVCFPLFIVLAMNEVTEKIAKNFFRTMLAEIFSQVFFAIAMLLVLSIITNFIGIMMSLDVGRIGGILFIYVLFNSVANVPELTKSWIGGNDGMGYRSLAKGMDNMVGSMEKMAVAASKASKALRERNDNKKDADQVQDAINKQDMSDIDNEMNSKEKQEANMSAAEKIIQQMNEGKKSASDGSDKENEDGEGSEESKTPLGEEAKDAATVETPQDSEQKVQQAESDVADAEEDMEKTRKAKQDAEETAHQKTGEAETANAEKEATEAVMAGNEENDNSTNGGTRVPKKPLNGTGTQTTDNNGTNPNGTPIDPKDKKNEANGSQEVGKQSTTNTEGEGKKEGEQKGGKYTESQREQMRQIGKNNMDGNRKEKIEAASSTLSDAYAAKNGASGITGNKADDLYRKLLGTGKSAPSTDDVRKEAVASQKEERNKLDAERDQLNAQMATAYSKEDQDAIQQKMEALDGKYEALDKKADEQAQNFIDHVNSQGMQFSDQKENDRVSVSKDASNEVMKGLQNGTTSRQDAKNTMSSDLQKNNPGMSKEDADKRAESIMKKYEDSSVGQMSWEAQRALHSHRKNGTLDAKNLKNVVTQDLMHQRGYDYRKAESEASQILNNSSLNSINRTNTEAKKGTHYDQNRGEKDPLYEKTLNERREKNKPGDSNFKVNGGGGEKGYPTEKEVKNQKVHNEDSPVIGKGNDGSEKENKKKKRRGYEETDSYQQSTTNDDSTRRDDEIITSPTEVNGSDSTPIVTEAESTTIEDGSDSTPIVTEAESTTIEDGSDSTPIVTEAESTTIEDGSDSTPIVTEAESTTIEDGSDSKPVDDGSDSKPVDDGSDSKPVDDGSDSKPVDDGNDSKPVDDGNDSKPVDDGNDSKPKDDGTFEDPRNI